MSLRSTRSMCSMTSTWFITSTRSVRVITEPWFSFLLKLDDVETPHLTPFSSLLLCIDDSESSVHRPHLSGYEPSPVHSFSSSLTVVIAVDSLPTGRAKQCCSLACHVCSKSSPARLIPFLVNKSFDLNFGLEIASKPIFKLPTPLYSPFPEGPPCQIWSGSVWQLGCYQGTNKHIDTIDLNDTDQSMTLMQFGNSTRHISLGISSPRVMAALPTDSTGLPST